MAPPSHPRSPSRRRFADIPSQEPQQAAQHATPHRIRSRLSTYQSHQLDSVEPVSYPPTSTTQPTSTPPPTSTTTSYLMVPLVVSFYFATSISVVLLNKYLLSHKQLNTVFVNMVQLLIASICSLVLAAITTLTQKLTTCTKDSTSTSQTIRSALYPLLHVLPLSLIFAFMLWLNNACLSFVAISFYQVARAWTTIFSIILSFVFFSTRPTIGQVLCCVVIAFGYITACDGELPWNDLYQEIVQLSRYVISSLLQLVPQKHIDSHVLAWVEQLNLTQLDSQLEITSSFHLTIGILLGALGSLVLAFYSILVKRLQTSTDISTNTLVTSLNIDATALMLGYLYSTGELSRLYNDNTLYQPDTLLSLLVVSLAGFLLSYATFWQVQYTSPLGHNVSGTAKACVQSAIGWYVQRNPISTTTAIGTGVTIIGCGSYALTGPAKSTSNNNSSQQQNAPPKVSVYASVPTWLWPFSRS